MTHPKMPQLQLNAAATAAERANRPAHFVTLTLALIAIAAIYVGLSGRSLASSRSELTRANADLATVEQRVNDLKSLQSGGVNLAELYPPDPYVVLSIEQAWKATGIDFTTAPQVGDPRTQAVQNNPKLQRKNVVCSVANDSLEKTMTWMEAIQEHEKLAGRVFISQVLLQPLPSGWRASFQVSWFEAIP